MRIDDELDFRERLDQAFDTVSPHPAPIEDTVQLGRGIKARRRVTVVVSIAVVAAIGASSALGSSPLHKLVAPPPATQVHKNAVTVQAPGPDAQAGLIASGTFSGQRWWIIADKPGIDGAGAGQQDIIVVGSAVGAPGGSDLLVPALSTANALGPVTFISTTGGTAQILFGAVQADVSYVTVRLGNGTVLTLRPVTVYDTRAVALAAPAATGIISVTAYSRHGELATAIPFNEPGRAPLFGAWLKPGQPRPAASSAVLFSGHADGYSGRMTVHQGPWGICGTFAGLSAVGCLPITSAPSGTHVLSWTQGSLTYVVGRTTAASVTRVVFTVPGEHSIAVKPVMVGGRRLFAAAFRVAKNPSWKAYNSSGAVVASGHLPASPAN